MLQMQKAVHSQKEKGKKNVQKTLNELKMSLHERVSITFIDPL